MKGMKGIKVTDNWKGIEPIWKSLKAEGKAFKIWKNKDGRWSIYF